MVNNQLTVTFGVLAVRSYFGGRLVGQQLGANIYEPVIQDRLGSVGKYYPYGEERNSPQLPNDQVKFATYTRDSATGNDYADQRYYTSVLGRFMTPDPYKASAGPSDPGSWDRYSYTRADPINRYDPSGMDDCGPEDDSSDCNQIPNAFILVSGTPPPNPKGTKPTSGYAPIKVTKLSNSNKQAVQVQNDLRSLTQAIDDDSKCLDWLTKNSSDPVAALNLVVNALLNTNNATGVAVGVGNFSDPNINALAGTFGTNIIPAGSMQITVNSAGAFFNGNVPVGPGVPQTILGDTSAAQAEILIHELAHIMNAFASSGSDYGNNYLEQQNNQAVMDNCGQVINSIHFQQ